MFDLESYLPYLINRAGVRLANAFGEVLESYRITLPMWRVMAALDHRGGQRVGQLAAMTSIEVSTLSRLLGAMEEKGLVLRQRSDEDARTVTVGLTELGARLTGQIIPTALHYEEVALQGFAPRETAALKAMLARVFKNLDRLDAGARERRRLSA